MKQNLFFFTIILLLFSAYSFAQEIFNVELPKQSFRLGEAFKAKIIPTQKFNADNWFKIELSDRYGNFSNPTLLGEIKERDTAFIQCSIPNNIELDKNYKIRAISTSPQKFYYLPANILLYVGRKYYVSTDGDDNNTGENTSPFKTIQHAIDLCWYYDTVLVLPGTYYENIVLKGIDIALIGAEGPQKTIIDGRANGNPALLIENSETEATIIDGFTIRNGRTYDMEIGAGITIRYFSTTPRLRNLIITKNEASAYGGGIYVFGSKKIEIKNCLIRENKARYFGAGIYSNDATLDLENCIIADNNPGGIFIYRNYANFTNCLIYNNTSTEVSIYSDKGIQLKPKLIHTTIASTPNNLALYLDGRFIAEIYNSIIFGKDSTISLVGDAYDTLKIAHSIVYNYPKGFRNTKVIVLLGKQVLSDDPLFISPQNGNFNLDSCSPALGLANKIFSPSYDLFAFPRPIDPNDEENPDMGAIESSYNQRQNIVNIINIPKTMFCKDETFKVDYSVTGCPFFIGNEFIVELSNENGDFLSGKEIGKVSSTSSGSINCTIPANAKAGKNYKIRIRGTNLPYRSKPFGQSIQIYDNPKALIFGDTNVCSRRPIEYWTDSSEIITNKWSIRNGISYNLLNENKIVVTWLDSASGTIKLTQTNVAGCKDSTAIKVTIRATPDKPTIQLLSDGYLVSNYPNGNQWYRNGNPIPGATGRMYLPQVNGYYSVKVKTPDGCESDMSDSVFILIHSVEERNKSNFYSLLPQSTNVWSINYRGVSPFKVEIVNELGIPLMAKTFESIASSYQINLNNFPAGVYFVIISNLETISVQKILVY